MPRMSEDRLRGRQLHDLPHVHHGDPIADVFDHREIVSHEQEREREPRLKLQKEIEHLRLHRDVQGGHGLVGHHEPRLGRERPRDPDALALAARERVGEAVQVFGAEAGQLEQGGDTLEAGAAVAEPVDQQRLADVVEDRHARVQRAEGILEDHLNLWPQRA